VRHLSARPVGRAVAACLLHQRSSLDGRAAASAGARDRGANKRAPTGAWNTILSMQPDSRTPYVQAIFAAIAIHSLEFVRLEDMARGPEAVARARHRGRLDRAAAAQLLGDR
jgi:hypothetical protein